MVKDEIYRLLAFPLSIEGMMRAYNEDFFMFENEKLMSYSVSLVGEIDDLLNNGCSKEEIIELINESDFTTSDPELTKEEADYLKRYSLKILNIRYRLFLEDKENNNPIIEDYDDEVIQIKRLAKKNKKRNTN